VTAHTARITTGLLQDCFGDRNVGRGKWPLRSPDLTPPELCGDFLKKEFTSKAPINLEERQQNFAETVQNLIPKFARNAVKTVNIVLQ
jgi:hypothetical protein